MEELEMLVKMVAGLPTLTVWILAGYLAYRLVVVGSIYGVIRLLIVKYHDYKVKPVVIEHKILARPISEEVLQELQVQITRIAGIGTYIHSGDVAKLRKALDMIEKGAVK